ncbi:MAG: aldo/keto reductase, partial [Actinomycetota bacterium]
MRCHDDDDVVFPPRRHVRPMLMSGPTDPLGPRFFGTVAASPLALRGAGLARLSRAAVDRLVGAATATGPALVTCGGPAAQAALGGTLAAVPSRRQLVALAVTSQGAPGLPCDSRPDTIIRSCHDALDRLGTDVIDLFLVNGYDHYTDPADVAVALTRLRTEGKVQEVGVSGYSPARYRT